MIDEGRDYLANQGHSDAKQNGTDEVTQSLHFIPPSVLRTGKGPRSKETFTRLGFRRIISSGVCLWK
jgi:hypothetical protein